MQIGASIPHRCISGAARSHLMGRLPTQTGKTMPVSFIVRCVPVVLLGTAIAGGSGSSVFAQPVPAPASPPGAPSGGASTATQGMEGEGPATTSKLHRRRAGETMAQAVDRRIVELHARMQIIARAHRQRAEKIHATSAVKNLQTFAPIERTRAQDLQRLVSALRRVV